MYNIINKHQIIKILLFSLCVFFFTLTEKQKIYAADVFFEGRTETLINVNKPFDSFFGGSDSTIGTLETGPTNLTFTTVGAFRNSVFRIIGGGRSSFNNPNTVKGNVTLTVYNTDVERIIGAGISNRGLVNVTGSVNMKLENVSVTRGIYGGVYTQNGHVLGSINMHLKNVQTPLLIGSGVSNGPNRITVNGDINIDVEDSRIQYVNITGEVDAGIKGNATLTVKKSTVELINSGRGNILGNLKISIADSNIRGLSPVDFGSSVYGDTSINVINSQINDITLIPRAGGMLVGPVTLDITSSTIQNIQCGPVSQNNQLNTLNVTVNTSNITNLNLGSVEGHTISTTATVTDSNITNLNVGTFNGLGVTENASVIINSGNITNLNVGTNVIAAATTINSSATIHDGLIANLTLGSQGNGRTMIATANVNGGTIGLLTMGSENFIPGTRPITELAILNMSGGLIERIIVGNANSSTINFTPGKRSIVKTINGPELPYLVNIQKGAMTQWGTKNMPFLLDTRNLILSGTLITSNIQLADLSITNLFVANGGTLVPRKLIPGNQPVIQFLGGPQSLLVIHQPLKVNLSLSPKLIGSSMVPLAFVSQSFSSPDLFVKQTRSGLIWSDLEFDPTTSIWYVNNIQASQDFYSFSIARETTNWLRQQHIWTLQNRSSKLLDNEHYGLWINVQGGHESLDTSIGSKAKMPWIMATAGYDYLQQLPRLDMKALYGLAFGASKGKSKWSSVNSTKNDAELGMVSGYVGLIHNKTGLYSTLTLQLASSKLHTNSTGFYRNFKWTETTPTEALELGWKYTFNNGIKMNPRGQLIFEQTSKHHFDLGIQNDKAILDKSQLITSSLGITVEYKLPVTTPINLYAGIERIKGQSGNFAISSQSLQMKFKHDNDTSVVRATIGTNILLGEHFNIHCDIFGDKGNDKGIGGQAGFTYKF
ncbi:autotransporter outer membrane beta-barrel domain-containing protein [Lawsonia intracellularis]|uniref:autotransporter outer membrane beta-barrel domain-containing protein n=1 Tax=Lawsonia intracellularis TaxID=29546 RepID=UPI001CBD98FB|nr:autotransporter outer membrane beta-barrel domain-containing protein [Lawsonia intracellularis]MBZ3893289.1 autotransporter outer membrane beta-barrel domain-containing protein [Lawsonia intracellularis]